MVVSRFGTGLAASLVIARASKYGFARASPPSFRWMSRTAVQPLLKPSHVASEDGTSTSELADPAETELPAFTTLEGRVSKRTLEAITHQPFSLKTMTSVQAAVLPLLPELARPFDPKDTSGPPRDLLVKARTGTGKTLAFLVPAIEAREKALEAHAEQQISDSGIPPDRHTADRVKRALAREQVGTLILSPTRELATQIANEAIKLTAHHPGFEVRLFVGGMSKRQQMREWMKGRRDIVVGTPGRVRDVLENEPGVAASMAKTNTFILDEADTLLEMGFEKELAAISEFLPPSPERQTFMFSATVSKNIREVARQTLDKKHLFINCVSDDAPPVHAHIPQHYTVLPDASHQIPHVLRLLAQDQLTNVNKSKTIVFLPTTKLTQLFASYLQELSDILPVGRRTRVHEMHSLLSQAARTRTSDRFRNDTASASILVSSDVSARGVDYPGVTRVIQVGIPSNADQYVHRVGRTGRGSSMTGRADLVLLPFEAGFVKWQLNNIPIKELKVADLQSEVEGLATSHDSDPSAFIEKTSPNSSIKSFVPKVLPGLQNIPEAVSSLHEQIDIDSTRATVSSLLGYYSARSGEMRASRSDILEGLKSWSMQACGLPSPPHFSQDFLTRIGFGDAGQQAAPRQRGSFGMRSRDSQRPSYSRGRDYDSQDRGSRSGFGSRGRDFDSQERGSRYGSRNRDRDFDSSDRIPKSSRSRSYGDLDRDRGSSRRREY